MNLKIELYKATGEKGEDLTLAVGEKFSTLNEQLYAQVLRVEANHIFSKNGKTQTKGEVRGGGRKPWKQKGTGRARAGSSRSPLWKGGGVTFGPTGINRELDIPKKMRKLAMMQLWAKAFKNKSVRVIEDLGDETRKTKQTSDIINKIAPKNSVTLIFSNPEAPKYKSWRNISIVEGREIDEVLAHDLVKKRDFILTKVAYDKIAGALK